MGVRFVLIEGSATRMPKTRNDDRDAQKEARRDLRGGLPIENSAELHWKERPTRHHTGFDGATPSCGMTNPAGPQPPTIGLKFMVLLKTGLPEATV